MRRQSSGFVALTVWCLGLCSTPALAQSTTPPAQPAVRTGWFEEYRTFSIYMENDVFAKWRNDTTDESYTQGLRLGWDFAQFPTLAQKASSPFMWVLRGVVRQERGTAIETACTPQVDRGHNCGTVGFSLNQTIYTPQDILTADLQPGDRPFAGFLFASASTHVRDKQLQSSTELLVGVTGRPSIAQNTQSLAHWTWSNGAGRPSGWHHQIQSAPQFALMQTWSGHLFERCSAGCSGVEAERRWLDLTPRVEVIAGNFMRRASAGGILRIGQRFPDRVGTRIPATFGGTDKADDKLWWAVSGAYDYRYVQHNVFLTGGGGDQEDGRWGAVRTIEPHRYIQERTIGASVGKRAFTASAQAVWRSKEWRSMVTTTQADKPLHAYLSAQISLHLGR